MFIAEYTYFYFKLSNFRYFVIAMAMHEYSLVQRHCREYDEKSMVLIQITNKDLLDMY